MYKYTYMCAFANKEGVAPSPTPWCSSYRKGSLRVNLDYGRPTLLTYKYTYMCPFVNKAIFLVYVQVYIHVSICQ